MALPRPLRRLLSLVLLNCLTGTEAGALAGVIKFVLGAAAARDAPARIAARRTVRACVLHVSQVKLIVKSSGREIEGRRVEEGERWVCLGSFTSWPGA